MKQRFGSRLLPAFSLTCALVLCCAGAAAEDTCVSPACHAALIEAKHVHPAAEACDSCHESVATPHPQQGHKTFKLSNEPPELCTACHEPLGTKSHVHPPVKEGMCTTCHDPHASNEPKLLTQPIEELCQTCHADHADFEYPHAPIASGDCTVCHVPHESDAPTLLRGEGNDVCATCHSEIQHLSQKPNAHPALALGCTTCHNPHGAARPKLLSKPEKETCLGCHATVITRNMTVLHGPIDEGQCTACHDPHGGKGPKLLAREFPLAAYVAYAGTEFSLCFGCHPRDLLRDPQTSSATNFRDGDTNLHYLHVNKEQKGRSCRLCHEIHGGDNTVLIADSVPFGKWKLPLKFVKTDTGGGCAPGCHRPQQYDRETKGR